jgi:hypothetical protein
MSVKDFCSNIAKRGIEFKNLKGFFKKFEILFLGLTVDRCTCLRLIFYCQFLEPYFELSRRLFEFILLSSGHLLENKNFINSIRGLYYKLKCGPKSPH